MERADGPAEVADRDAVLDDDVQVDRGLPLADLDRHALAQAATVARRA